MCKQKKIMADTISEIVELVNGLADLMDQAGDSFRADWLRKRAELLPRDEQAVLSELGGFAIFGGMDQLSTSCGPIATR